MAPTLLPWGAPLVVYFARVGVASSIASHAVRAARGSEGSAVVVGATTKASAGEALSAMKASTSAAAALASATSASRSALRGRPRARFASAAALTAGGSVDVTTLRAILFAEVSALCLFSLRAPLAALRLPLSSSSGSGSSDGSIISAASANTHLERLS